MNMFEMMKPQLVVLLEGTVAAMEKKSRENLRRCESMAANSPEFMSCYTRAGIWADAVDMIRESLKP